MGVASAPDLRQPARRETSSMDDDLKPRPKPPEHVMGQDLSTLSVHELNERIALLKI